MNPGEHYLEIDETEKSLIEGISEAIDINDGNLAKRLPRDDTPTTQMNPLHVTSAVFNTRLWFRKLG
jgi:hypothetical protein